MNLEEFRKLGYTVEEGVLNEAECDALIDNSAHLESYQKGLYYPQMMPHRTHAIYLQALRHPKIVASIEQAVGGTASGLQTQFFYCKPGTPGFGRHQDNFFVEAQPQTFVSAWCALTDVAIENGALIAWAGTHNEGMLPVQKIQMEKDKSQDPNANNEETVVPAKYSPESLVVKKGSVVYIDQYLVHASNANKSQDKWRQVLLSTYIKKGATFRAGNYAQRAEIEL